MIKLFVLLCFLFASSKGEGIKDLLKELEDEVANKNYLTKVQENKDIKEKEVKNTKGGRFGNVLKELEDEIEANKKHQKQKEANDEANVIADLKSVMQRLDNMIVVKNVSEDLKTSLEWFKANSIVVNPDLQDQKDNAASEEVCVDAKDLNFCYKEFVKGSCEDKKEMMKKNCKRTCRYCCADDQTFVSTEKCATFKKFKACQKEDYQDRMRVLCPKTCKFCGRGLAQPPCVNSQYGCCWEGSTAKNHIGTVDDGCPECQNFREDSFCLKFKTDCNNIFTIAGSQIRLMCPKTCERCGIHSVCQDDHAMRDSCIEQAQNNGCVDQFHAMRYSCAKTCGICDKSTIHCAKTRYGCCADGVAIAKGPYRKGCKECTNPPANKATCKRLAKYGACLSHKERMAKYCPETCQSCVP